MHARSDTSKAMCTLTGGTSEECPFKFPVNKDNHGTNVKNHLRGFLRLLTSVHRRLCEYPIVELESDSPPCVGVDARGVTHALAWHFDETKGWLEGRCGANIDVRTQGTVNCMTCLVKETGET